MKKASFKIISIIFRLICLFFAIFLLVYIPTINIGVNDNLNRIYGSFVGEKSSFNGIIEVWNIDSFESGSQSKTNLLNIAAAEYQKKYKGVYVLVRNISEQECVNMLLQGQTPDLFSCSYGVSLKIKSYIESFRETDFNLKDNFFNAGKDENGELGAVAWCSGLYFLITTKNMLEKAGVSVDNFNIFENVYSLGFKTQGKTLKNIYSITFANKGYLMPQQALNSYDINGAEKFSELAYNKGNNLSQYEAYVDFLLGNSVMLLGSQRDVVRLVNRETAGKISEVVYKPLLSSTDLVQFLFLAKNENEEEKVYCEKFAKFILSETIQSKIAGSNMFSVIDNFSYDYKIDVFNEAANEDLKNLKVKNIFS